MEPIALVTLFLAALIVAGRVGFIVAPKETAAFYRRTVYATDARMRVFGVGLLLLIAAPLLVTARQASAGPTGTLSFLQGLGWVITIASAWVIVTPGVVRRLGTKLLVAAPVSVLRTIGLLGVAFGIFLAAVALFEL